MVRRRRGGFAAAARGAARPGARNGRAGARAPPAAAGGAGCAFLHPLLTPLACFATTPLAVFTSPAAVQSVTKLAIEPMLGFITKVTAVRVAASNNPAAARPLREQASHAPRAPARAGAGAARLWVGRRAGRKATYRVVYSNFHICKSASRLRARFKLVRTKPPPAGVCVGRQALRGGGPRQRGHGGARARGGRQGLPLPLKPRDAGHPLPVRLPRGRAGRLWSPPALPIA